MPAIYDAWIVWDEFLGETIGALFEMHNAAAIKKKQLPYLYDIYTVFTYIPSKNLRAHHAIAITYNAFAEGQNNRIRLPRFSNR